MVNSSPGVAPRIARSTWKVMATVSTDWPAVAGCRAMAVTVPRKIVPAAVVSLGKSGVIGDRRRRFDTGAVPIGSRSGFSRSRGSATERSAAELAWSDWPHRKGGGTSQHTNMSRQEQLLPNMGRPQDETSARRVTGPETAQPSLIARTKSVTDVTTACGELGLSRESRVGSCASRGVDPKPDTPSEYLCLRRQRREL